MSFVRCVHALTCVTKNVLKSNSFIGVVSRVGRPFSVNSSRLSDIKFTLDHEWIAMDGNVGTVGLSGHAQESLGEIVYVELPEPGTEFDKTDCVGVVESVKAVGEIYCPVTGTITEANQKVVDKPGLINSNYNDKGWLFKIELSDMSELDEHMTPEQYDAHLKTL